MSEPTTYGMNDWKLYDALVDNPDIVCAIPVHLFGGVCDCIHDIIALCNTRGIAVIEDSCECMFAKSGTQSVGSFGSIAAFSFYIAHLLTAGVGGISITNNPDYAAKMRSLVNHGRDGIYISIDDDKVFNAEQISRRFHFESIGHSFRITELEAAIALAQLEDWESMIAKRRGNGDYLTRLLLTYNQRSGDRRLALPFVQDSTSHSFMMYPIVLREGDKWPLCNYLEQHGIETRELVPLINQPAYRGMWEPDDYPVSQWLERGGFYVGCHQDLTHKDMEYIAECIIAWLKNN